MDDKYIPWFLLTILAGIGMMGFLLYLLIQQKTTTTSTPIVRVTPQQPQQIIPLLLPKTSHVIGPDSEITIGPTSSVELFTEKVPGGIEEIVIVSPSEHFGIEIQRDGEIILDKTYSELNAVTTQSKYISAKTDFDGNHMLNIGEYTTWRDSITVILKASEYFKFHHVYAKWYTEQ